MDRVLDILCSCYLTIFSLKTSQTHSMAYFLLSNHSYTSLTPKPHSKPISKTYSNQIRCGPRSNRGPLLKGRTLSSEAIQAVQSLKRSSHRQSNGPPNSLLKNTLSRLIKSDLIAAFKELVRQDHLDLALLVFSAVRSEYHADLTAYSDLVSSLHSGQRPDDIDRLIIELELEIEMEGYRLSPPSSFPVLHSDGGSDIGSTTRLSLPSSFPMDTYESGNGSDIGSNARMSPSCSFYKGSSSRPSLPGSFVDDKGGKKGVIGCDDRKGLVRLVKALIAAGRGQSTVRMYEMMRRSGWGSDRTMEDEYLGRVLERGFKSFGEDRLAKEIGDLFSGGLEK